MLHINGDAMIHVGTSGFSYKHWKGVFYPSDVTPRRWLEFYSTWFDCVEINSSFYRLPKASVVESWHDRVPENFLFVLKGSRMVTHVKRLRDCEESIDLFYERIASLKEKLGGVLWQLPPGLHLDLPRLNEFLKCLPPNPTPVLEFRHPSWFVEEVFDLLRKRDAVFCIHDMPPGECPRRITAPMVYFRFHGQTGKYAGSYSDEVLESCAQWIAACGIEEGYVFFNNDIDGVAVQNATILRGFL